MRPSRLAPLARSGALVLVASVGVPDVDIYPRDNDSYKHRDWRSRNKPRPKKRRKAKGKS